MISPCFDPGMGNLYDSLYDGYPVSILPEVIAVRHGLKPCGLYVVDEADIGPVTAGLRNACASLILATVRMPDKNTGWDYLSPDERESLMNRRPHVVLFAMGNVALERTREAYVSGNSGLLGMALGYPECCIQANSLFGASRTNDYVRLLKTSPEPYHWQLNVFLQSLRLRGGSPYYLSSHFPCSLNCEASLSKANDLYELILKLSQGFAERLKVMLSLPLLILDDTDLTDSERTGLCGAMFRGIVQEGGIVYAAWHPLRHHEPLKRLNLEDGNCAVTHDGGIIISDLTSGRHVSDSTGKWLVAEFK